MKTKFYHYFLSFVMILGVVSLVSCGDKDKDEDEGTVDSPLIGTWVYNENGSGKFIFKGNGDVEMHKYYYMYEEETDPYEDFMYTGTYTYSEENNEATINFTKMSITMRGEEQAPLEDIEEPFVTVCKNISLNGNTLSFSANLDQYGYGEEEVYTLKKR